MKKNKWEKQYVSAPGVKRLNEIDSGYEASRAVSAPTRTWLMLVPFLSSFLNYLYKDNPWNTLFLIDWKKTINNNHTLNESKLLKNVLVYVFLKAGVCSSIPLPGAYELSTACPVLPGPGGSALNASNTASSSTMGRIGIHQINMQIINSN